MLHVMSKMARVSVVGSLMIFLAACSGQKVSHSDVQASSSSEGNVLQNSVGEKLNFVSINNESLGNISSISSQGDSLYVQLKNPNTGRQALVRVDLDSATRKFKSVNPTSVPYMCYNPSTDACAAANVPAAYPNAGAATINCDSPIYFNGSLNGSVGNIQTPNSARCAGL